jgi:hypothetical protein
VERFLRPGEKAREQADIISRFGGQQPRRNGLCGSPARRFEPDLQCCAQSVYRSSPTVSGTGAGRLLLPSSREFGNLLAFMDPGKPLVAVYDTKPYDREYLKAATGVDELNLQFHEFRLEPGTAFSAEGS